MPARCQACIRSAQVLEENLNPELNLSCRCCRRGGFSCCRTGTHSSASVWNEQIRIGLSKIRMIQSVEEFCPELNGGRFMQLDVFDQRQVCCKEPRSLKRVATYIPRQTGRLE